MLCHPGIESPNGRFNIQDPEKNNEVDPGCRNAITLPAPG